MNEVFKEKDYTLETLGDEVESLQAQVDVLTDAVIRLLKILDASGHIDANAVINAVVLARNQPPNPALEHAAWVLEQLLKSSFPDDEA